MAQPGRPCLLTPGVEQDLVDALTSGADIKTACEAAGVGVRTFHTWLEIGAKELPETPTPEQTTEFEAAAKYRQFRHAVTRARARVRARASAYWLKHFETDWRACAEYLARTDPENWAPIEKRVLMGDAKAPLNVSVNGNSLSTATDQQIDQLLAQTSALLAAATGDSGASRGGPEGEGAP